jgi:hypothetical protein
MSVMWRPTISPVGLDVSKNSTTYIASPCVLTTLQVLALDASNVEAIACLAADHFYSDQPELALQYYRRLLQVRALPASSTFLCMHTLSSRSRADGGSCWCSSKPNWSCPPGTDLTHAHQQFIPAIHSAHAMLDTRMIGRPQMGVVNDEMWCHCKHGHQ